MFSVFGTVRMLHTFVVITERRKIKQKVLERTNLPTFLTLFKNKLKSLQRYGIAQNYRILHSVSPNITSKFRTIAIPKNSAKNKLIILQTCSYVHDLLLYETSLVYVQQFMSCLHKTEYEF
jgi:hypothetical protein